MSHITGTLQTLGSPITIGPDTGTPETSPNIWAHDFAYTPAPMGTKLVMLHFQNVNLPASNRLEVDLGYDTDVFTSADGSEFWTRPVNVYSFSGGPVPIRYITNGAANGSVELDRYGRGERHAGEPGHASFSNSDPFIEGASYDEPTYDPFWYCDEPPSWENAACVSAPDIRAQVTRSVGMIVSVEGAFLSTCSVTLVDADKVITAGHCHTPDEALTSSVTFDYQTDCVGGKPGSYNARFYKVAEVLQHTWTSTHDYSLLRLASAPPGVPVVQLRHDLPAIGEQVFGVHHPNGAVKKLSIPHPGFTTVSGTSATSVNVPSEFDVSGGSSGSGLFDTAGRIIGVLSNGDPCGNSGPPSALKYYPMAAFLTQTVPAPPTPITRDVMLVMDRSGSMSMDDGTGRTKMDVAKDAASLFVQLVQADTGNRVGMVSFSTGASSPVDFDIADVTNANKTTLIGSAPYSGGKVGDLIADGMTSIGEGLDAARARFPAPGTNPRSILLMTDGLQNTHRMINEVEGALGTIQVHAIGLGSESSLDGPLLTQLATDHDGLYMRAGNGLALEKFFTEAFGNIFEAGILFDPEFDLPAGQHGAPITFPVCGEEAITAVVGWDRTDADLLLEITTPGGAVITSSTGGVTHATGITWSFLRLKLPHGGERNGLWKVRVLRPTGGSEFPPPTPALRYFLNVVPTGGPRFLRAGAPKRRYYTGDFLNPLVMLRYADGGWPDDATVKLTLTRPDRGAGNILAASGLGPAAVQDGDALPPRWATLQKMEADTGAPIVKYVATQFTLVADSHHTGFFEAGGIHGNPMFDELNVEGNYTLHAKATYGSACQGTRELTWSISVDVGIDPDRTIVTSELLGPDGDGNECFRLTMTPKDRYGNVLGPGRADAFTVLPHGGTKIAGAVHDVGKGAYRFDICWDPTSGEPPGVSVGQPDRPPVVVPVPDIRLFTHNVTFICGEQADDCCGCDPVRPGRYATEINILNFHEKPAPVIKLITPLVLAGAVKGREPQVVRPSAIDRIALPAHAATMDDCCRLLELLLGAKSSSPLPVTIGVLQIISLVELSVSAVYTVSDLSNHVTNIDVEEIAPRLLTLERAGRTAPGATRTAEPAPKPAPGGHNH